MPVRKSVKLKQIGVKYNLLVFVDIAFTDKVDQLRSFSGNSLARNRKCEIVNHKTKCIYLTRADRLNMLTRAA